MMNWPRLEATRAIFLTRCLGRSCSVAETVVKFR